VPSLRLFLQSFSSFRFLGFFTLGFAFALLIFVISLCKAEELVSKVWQAF